MTPNDTAPARDAAAAALPRAFPRIVFVLAAVLLSAGVLLYLGAAAQLVWPGFLGGTGSLSFGRLLPAGTGLLLGWLLLAAIGGAWYVLPRIGGGPVDIRLMIPAGLLVGAGAVTGAVGAAAGLGEGGRFVEGPWFAEAALAAGLLLGGIATVRSARCADRDLPISGWYFIGSLWWASAAAAVAAWPGLEGIPGALQARFAATVLTGLAPVAAGLGGAYYLLGRLIPEAGSHPRLGPIGFWSLGFSWLWLGPASFQYGPTPDWLETIPVLFSFGLVVALLAVFADLAQTARGRWDVVAASQPLRLVAAGSPFFVLLVGQMLIQTLRGPSTVVHFTDWASAFDLLLLLGAATLWTAALVAHVVPGERGWARRLGTLHVSGAVGGGLLALIGFWVAGLQQGYSWVGAAGDEGANLGDAFRSSVVPLEAMRVVGVVGLTIVAAASAAFLISILAGAAVRDRTAAEAVGLPGSGSSGLSVWAGAVVLYVVAGLAVFALPALEVDEGRPPATSALAEEGRKVYAAEGCWQCHTRQVRPIVTDVGLGPVSVPGDYAGDPSDLAGSRRVGPDLAHVGSRGWEPALLVEHLIDPRASRPWSVMPAFGYLADSDLEALAAYLASQE